jgi:3-mercaptopropionate dioxygenase
MNRTALSGAFAQFLNQMDALVAAAPAELALLDQAEQDLRALIASDAWLPAAYKAADPVKYQQHALYIDPQSRYSVVSFVWGPGQQTPVHNHTVWGLVGVLDGEEGCEEFACDAHGHWQPAHAHTLPRGEVDRVSPTLVMCTACATPSPTDHRSVFTCMAAISGASSAACLMRMAVCGLS